MIKFFKKLYAQLDVTELQAQQLKDARLELLKAESSKEYWSAMAAMLKGRVERLNNDK